jgi:hypothetical protein
LTIWGIRVEPYAHAGMSLDLAVKH